MSDVVAVSTPPPRTYPAPSDVVAEVMQGVRWARTYDIDVPEHYQSAASLLASAPSLEADRIDELALLFDTAVHTDSTSDRKPGSGGYPSKQRILASLAGGEPLKQWSETVLSSLERSSEAEHEALLSSIGFDPRTYRYRGLCTNGDPDVVTHLARVAGGSWQHWDPSLLEWRDLDAGLVSSCPAVDPDESLLAAIVDAVSYGDALALVYGTPVSFLPSGIPVDTLGDDVESTMTAAVVDDIDSTAVWSLVRLSPGQKIAVRAAGVWEDTDHWPSGCDVVYLSDEGLISRVTADVDAVDTSVPETARYLTVDELRSWATGDGEPVDLVTVRPDGTVEKLDRMFAGVISGLDGGPYDDEDDEDEERDRTRSLISDAETLREWSVLRARRDALTAALDNNRVTTPLVAQLGGPDRNRGGARRLRRYWTRGKGALKIAWGTHGDWRRCYRQLVKHMGPRAAGWCQLRHKEETGMYTGNKAHRAGVSTVKASASAATSALTAAHSDTGAMIALVPRETDITRLTVPNGEPADEMHLTLCFLGEIAEWAPEQLQAVQSRVASVVDDVVVPDLDDPSGIVAEAFGAALWNPDDSPVWVYSIGGSAEISWVYDIVKDVLGEVEEEIGELPIPDQHVPYIPHVTAKYGRNPATLDEMTSRLGTVVFDRLRVSFGHEVIDYRIDYLSSADSETDNEANEARKADHDRDAY